MYSIGFPKMLLGSSTSIISDHAATAQNILLLLKSDRFTLFGDPYFGTMIKSLIFEQNNLILKDLVIDEIYTCIRTFMPQLQLTRNDITLTIDKVDVYVTIRCINLIDYKIDLYTIKLTDDSKY